MPVAYVLVPPGATAKALARHLGIPTGARMTQAQITEAVCHTYHRAGVRLVPIDETRHHPTTRPHTRAVGRRPTPAPPRAAVRPRAARAAGTPRSGGQVPERPIDAGGCGHRLREPSFAPGHSHPAPRRPRVGGYCRASNFERVQTCLSGRPLGRGCAMGNRRGRAPMRQASRASSPPRPLRGTTWWAAVTVVALAVAAGDHLLGFREALTGRQFDGQDGPRWIVGLALAGVPFLRWVAGVRSHALFRPGEPPRELFRSAVAPWLIPFHQWWAPFGLMRAIVGATTTGAWPRVALRMWWTLWIGMWTAWWFSVWVGLSADSAGRGADVWVRGADAAFRALATLAGCAAIVLVVTLTRARQARRAEPAAERTWAQLRRDELDFASRTSVAVCLLAALPACWIGSTYLDSGPLSVALSRDELVGTWHDPAGAGVTLTADGLFSARGLPGSRWQLGDPDRLPPPISERCSGQGHWTYTKGTLTLTGPDRDSSRSPSTPPEFTLEDLRPKGSHTDPRLVVHLGDPDGGLRYELRKE